MPDIRELINPHDAITLDCSDIDAARLAVLVVGKGRYAIRDDAMPLFVLGGSTEWIQKTYRMTDEQFFDSISGDRLATALESFALTGGRSSTCNPVGYAHDVAKRIRKQIAALAAKKG